MEIFRSEVSNQFTRLHGFGFGLVPLLEEAGLMKANGLVLAAAGSAIGAFLRFLVGELLASESSLAFPVSTLLANLLGCLLIGLLAGR